MCLEELQRSTDFNCAFTNLVFLEECLEENILIHIQNGECIHHEKNPHLGEA